MYRQPRGTAFVYLLIKNTKKAIALRGDVYDGKCLKRLHVELVSHKTCKLHITIPEVYHYKYRKIVPPKFVTFELYWMFRVDCINN